MLDALSTELLETISAFLDRSDLSSLRLVCRSLCTSTAAVFGTAWLGIAETDLSEDGMRRLETIAGHEIFRTSVHTLRIVRLEKSDPGDGIIRLRPVPYVNKESVLGGKRSWPRRGSSVIDLSSTLAKNFQSILCRLDKCVTVEICDLPGNPPGDDGRAFGLSPVDALHLVLSAMAQGANHIRAMRIDMQRMPVTGDRRQFPSIAVSPAMFPTLQDLDLFWRIRTELVWQILGVITAATHLKRLHMIFDVSEGADGFLHHLAAVPILPPIADLRLGSMRSVSDTALVHVILRFRHSLRKLHIGHLELGNGHWQTVFETLSRVDFPCLESIALCYLRAPHPPVPHRQKQAYFCHLRLKQEALERCGGIFEFMLCPDRPKWRVSGVRYTGTPTSIKLVLDALADRSHYLLACTGKSNRSPSPGLPDMKTYIGDRVGRVVPRFDQIQTWYGLIA